jgi:mono/diheme cytochrome c family protein
VSLGKDAGGLWRRVIVGQKRWPVLPARALGLRRAGVLGIVVAGLFVGGCGSEGIPDDSGASRGRELFLGEGQCAGCHTLADAGSQSSIGPNLDEAFEYVRREGFDESSIRSLVRNQIAYPVEDPVTGETGMPANLVEGEDADAVAAYVASVAGTGASARGGAGGRITATEGKEIFSAAGCGSCHVLADAGTSGTIGPNLDQSQPTVELAIDRVTNGSGQMPSFGDRLNEAQIRAVARYVNEAAGG